MEFSPRIGVAIAVQIMGNEVLAKRSAEPRSVASWSTVCRLQAWLGAVSGIPAKNPPASPFALMSHMHRICEHSRETAQVTTAQLENACTEHGAPLVLKADGGPAFRSDELSQLLDQHGVELLPSPPYRPEYNGS